MRGQGIEGRAAAENRCVSGVRCRESPATLRGWALWVTVCGSQRAHPWAAATTREAKWTRNEWEGAFLRLLRAAFKADRAKDAALTASDYKVLRFTYDDDPQLAIDRLRALLA